jgi:hypothetical protein
VFGCAAQDVADAGSDTGNRLCVIRIRHDSAVADSAYTESLAVDANFLILIVLVLFIVLIVVLTIFVVIVLVFIIIVIVAMPGRHGAARAAIPRAWRCGTG